MGTRVYTWSCKCPGPRSERMGQWWVERRKLRDRREAWAVLQSEPSRYSDVVCYGCGAQWRTDAAYIDQLEDEPESQWM